MASAGQVLIEVLLLLAFTVLACRWTFGSQGVRRVVHRPDYGLLKPVARTDTAEAAEVIRHRLAEAGLRVTVAPAGAGLTAAGRAWPTGARVVLVFPDDVAAAQRLLRAAPSR